MFSETTKLDINPVEIVAFGDALKKTETVLIPDAIAYQTIWSANDVDGAILSKTAVLAVGKVGKVDRVG